MWAAFLVAGAVGLMAGSLLMRDPKRCGSPSPFYTMLGYSMAKGYQYSVSQMGFRKRKKPSFWGFIGETLRGAVTGGVTSAAFYGAGKGLEKFKMTFKSKELVVRDSRFLNADGKIDWNTWAPNDGRVPGTVQRGQTLSAGTIIDRYGSPHGKYTSPVGVPYEQGALPYVENPKAYHRYEVLKPIDNAITSQIAKAFEQPGGGIQYELPLNVKALIKGKFLKAIK